MHRASTLATYALTVMVTLAFYLVPLGIMAAAVHLGWHADPPAHTETSAAGGGLRRLVNLTTFCQLVSHCCGGVLTDPGDDNGDGVIDEDESGWDCTTMGNLICGLVIA